MYDNIIFVHSDKIKTIEALIKKAHSHDGQSAVREDRLENDDQPIRKRK